MAAQSALDPIGSLVFTLGVIVIILGKLLGHEDMVAKGNVYEKSNG